MKCREPATYARHTQFSGRFFYCEPHAKEQADFGQEDSSYFFWDKLDEPDNETS